MRFLMRRSAIRFLTPTLYATAAVIVSLVAAAAGEARSRDLRMHHAQPGHVFRSSWAAGEIRTIAPPYRSEGGVCPGNARSFDCRIWPPPFDDDADRRSGDGGGG